jgi:hypothetical protein
MCPRSQQPAQHLGSCARPLTSLLFKCEGSRPCGSPRNPNRRCLRPPTKYRPSPGGAGRAELLPERSISRSPWAGIRHLRSRVRSVFSATDSAGAASLASTTIGQRNGSGLERLLGRPASLFGLGAWIHCSGGRWCFQLALSSSSRPPPQACLASVGLDWVSVTRAPLRGRRCPVELAITAKRPPLGTERRPQGGDWLGPRRAKYRALYCQNPSALCHGLYDDSLASPC